MSPLRLKLTPFVPIMSYFHAHRYPYPYSYPYAPLRTVCWRSAPPPERNDVSVQLHAFCSFLFHRQDLKSDEMSMTVKMFSFRGPTDKISRRRITNLCWIRFYVGLSRTRAYTRSSLRFKICSTKLSRLRWYGVGSVSKKKMNGMEWYYYLMLVLHSIFPAVFLSPCCILLIFIGAFPIKIWRVLTGIKSNFTNEIGLRANLMTFFWWRGMYRELCICCIFRPPYIPAPSLHKKSQFF